MSALILLILGLFTALPPASCQQGLGNLQPWMQGLIAVAVFLVLVAIAFAVNHFWCQEEPFRSNEHENAYENIPEEEGRVRSTPM
ncbi:PDZK1-interacting protein 1 isoform X2 [Prionailurus iriomotensis]